MSDTSLPKITPLPDGPLALEENAAAGQCLCGGDDRPLPDPGPHMLCRCGGSSSKPFCDGTHMSNGFSSENVSDRRRDHRDDYEGEGLVVHDNRHACAHAEECIHGAPEVFHKMHRPWVTPAGADPDHVAEVIRRCPSGALSHSRDGEELRDLDRPPRVIVRAGGPYHVQGFVRLAVDEDAWADRVSREHYALCRCGGSLNKPFCDGTHWRNGFAEAGE
ncbi:MAG TPA: CDGSH iron-sulfur domain-containing protein [Coriobacteriia bacterium]